MSGGDTKKASVGGTAEDWTEGGTLGRTGDGTAGGAKVGTLDGPDTGTEGGTGGAAEGTDKASGASAPLPKEETRPARGNGLDEAPASGPVP